MRSLEILCLAQGVAAAVAAGTNAATVTVDWATEKVETHTAATVEVDVMPFLGRADWGGPFNAYYEALANLGSEYVRYAPWFPNPRVVVPELKPSDCTATKPATNWNSSYFDDIMRDFMEAVCGPNAIRGECKLSVVQQLSTMPEWMYVGGYCPDPDGCLPDFPWNTTDPFSLYASGHALKDPTCGEMARYMGRLVGHYTSGGHYDECGHFHPSGFNYSWWGLSVLNEDEHNIKPDDGTAYTTCYDAIMAEVRNPKNGNNQEIVGVGPEIAGTSGRSTEYIMHFLDPKNHKGYKGTGKGEVPKVSSFHWGGSASAPADAPEGGEKFLEEWESALNDPQGTMQQVQAYKAKTGQKTEMVLNEYIPFIGDWCDVTNSKLAPGGRCPDWQHTETAGGNPDLRARAGLGINRKTWSWNAAAACFAYGYGTLAELQYKYVGQDQLIGGTWPDNEPAVSCMDWQTGEVNAKYWVINLLAMTVGDSKPKSIKASNVTAAPPPPGPPPPPIGTTKTGNCGMTAYRPLLDCDTGPGSGALNTTTYGMKTVTDCVDKVKTCKNANYVSFSLDPAHEDCSWYSHCDFGNLAHLQANYESEVVTGRDSGGGAPTDSSPVYVMPYVKDMKKGLLVVNKKAASLELKIAGATGGLATVVEVNTDASCSDPGFEPQVRKEVSSDGVLSVGPFGVAVVTELLE